MRHIQLTQGKTASVDDVDYEALNKYKWHLHSTGSDKIYASRCFRTTDGKNGVVLMHRQILNPRKDQCIDHRDGNGLNNQRSNIRIANYSENVRNSRLKSNNKSGHTGVFWRPELQKWQSTISIYGKRISLGCFRDFDEAVSAYRNCSKENYGEFCNFSLVSG